MSRLTAAAALTVATVMAVVTSGARRTDNDLHGTRGHTSAAATYTLNGQNVERPRDDDTADRYAVQPKNVIGTRVQVWDDRAFVLTPRFRPGVPFTVSAVRLDCAPDSRCWPVLAPYPDWSRHDAADPNAVQNAVDMHLDPTGVLWVLDSGLVDTMEQPVRRTQPRIFAVDVKTDKVAKRIDLSGLVCPASRLNYITADHGDDGRAFVYVSDAATRAVIVWDVAAARGYRAVLPKAVTHDCTGRRDAMYVALARRPAGNNVLYLTYLTSGRMYAIDTCDLRHRERSQGTVTDMGPKPDNMVVLGTDGGTTLYFRYRGRGDVYAWDTDDRLDASRLALIRKAEDHDRLATQVAPGHPGVELWVLDSNFPDYISGTVGGLGVDVRLQSLQVMDRI